DAAHDDGEFLAALQEMVKSLGQSHIGIGPPREPEESKPGASPGTVGLHAGWFDGKLLVTRVEKSSPAERASILAGDEILEVGGEPVAKLVEDLPPMLGERWQGAVPYVFHEATAGAIGGKVRLDVASAGGARRSVELVRAAPEFPAFDF